MSLASADGDADPVATAVAELFSGEGCGGLSACSLGGGDDPISSASCASCSAVKVPPL
jgi:hypothetical protein